MDPKKLKKIVKRQTAKKRAQRQTSRRRQQQETGRNDRQVAQDLYSQPKGGPKRRRTGEEYRLKQYDYDMFKYGAPVRVGAKASPAAPAKSRRRNSASRKRTDFKAEAKRKAMWVQNIKLTKERKKKAGRIERKKRRTKEVRRSKKPTSRKLKKS
jgi:hypothetical protein